MQMWLLSSPSRINFHLLALLAYDNRFVLSFYRYFEGHTHAVMWLYITSNDKYLFTGSRDCTLKAWDLTSGKILDSFNCACQIKFFEVAEMTESHYRVMAANKTGEMGLFDFYLDSACRVPNYCLKR